MSFTKRLVIASWGLVGVLIILSVLLPALGLNNEGVLTAMPYAFGDAGIVNTFYIWKSKNENRHKYAMLYVDKIAEKFDIETAVRIAEIVLKE